jgi:hypothetical protein
MEIIMKNFISLALCSLFFVQSASAAEMPRRTKYERWKRIAPSALSTCLFGGGAHSALTWASAERTKYHVSRCKAHIIEQELSRLKLPVNTNIVNTEINNQHKEAESAYTASWLGLIFFTTPLAALAVASSLHTYELFVS